MSLIANHMSLIARHMLRCLYELVKTTLASSLYHLLVHVDMIITDAESNRCADLRALTNTQ